MRKTLFPVLLLAGLAFASCGKDEITKVDDVNGPTDTGSDDDDVDPADYDRLITIVYESTTATVSGAGDEQTVSVSGAHVTVSNTGSEKVRYLLSGASGDGSLKIYSGKRQIVALQGLALTNPTGAAINVQGSEETPADGKRVDLVVEGTNSLADGATYSTVEGEDEKGVVFAEGKIIVSGTGTLNVTATGGCATVRVGGSPVISLTSTATHALRCKKLLQIDGGDITATASAGTSYDSEDGEYKGCAAVRAKEGAFVINGGTLTAKHTGQGGKAINVDSAAAFNGGEVTVTVSGSNYGSSGGGGGWGPWGGGGSSSSSSVSAKGIKAKGDITISGGSIVATATAHEAIETKGKMLISGGVVYAYSAKDDAINSASDFTITGGHVCGHSAGNDGLDANGNFYIQGGVIYAIGTSSPELAVDANTEGGYKLYVSGGTLVAIGGLENGAQLTQSCYKASSWSKNVWYALTVGDAVYAFKTPASAGSPLVVSGEQTPTLTSGVSVSGGTSYFNGTFCENATVSGGSAVSLSNYTGGNSGGGGGGGWGPGH